MASIWTMGEILVEIMRPRAGMPLDKTGEFLGPYPSGAPAIFIDTAARLGHSAGIIGGVGDDDFGRCVVARLERDGVDCRFVRCFPGESTAVAFVTYFADGSRQFLYHIDRTPAVMNGFTGQEWAGVQEDSTIAFFHIMGCSLMANDEFRENIFQAARAAQLHGARISFDPNIRAELLRGRPLDDVIGPALQNCSVLLPGEAELALISGASEPAEGARRMLDRYPLDLIVLKRGRRGCTVFTRSRALDVPAYLVDEIDPTGAGDCFDAAFLCGLLEDRPLDECARMAAAAGALNAAAFGPMEGDLSPESIARLMGEP